MRFTVPDSIGGSARNLLDGRLDRVKIAHVRERNAPGWHALAVGCGPRRRARSRQRWLDLEDARQGLVVEDPRRAHNSVLFRQPITTLDEHLARGLRVEALAEIVDGYAAAREDDEAVLDAADLVFGPPILRPPSLRDFYAFEGHVRTMWERRGGTVPEAWYRLPIFYFSNVSEIRGPGEPVWCPAASQELDYELEVAALIDTPVHDLAAERRRGGDRRLPDLQRLERPRPAARGDHRPPGARQGQGFRQLHRSLAGHAGRAGRRAPRATGTTWP